MRKLFLLLFILCVVTVGWLFRDDVRPVWVWVTLRMERDASEKTADTQVPEPDREAYDLLKQGLERWRKKLQEQHRKARTEEARRLVENDARVLLESVMPEMMRCWLGTPWDFNGTAAGPGKDPVACGYFVSTLLQDAGFRLDRYRLAQQPSSRILTSLIPGDTCRLMVDLPYEQFASEMKQMAAGIYVVGLDTHVAFMVVGPEGFRFIHSSGSKPWRVVDEGRENADVLQRSRWRMLGNLTADEELLRKWLAREAIPVRTS